MEISVEIVTLTEDYETKHPIVVLFDGVDNYLLPIWIGELEARAIDVALNNTELSYPLTHDLTLSAIFALGGDLVKIVIDRLEKDRYNASIYIQQDDEIIAIDARPSDALAVALTSDTPIFVDHDVMRRGGQENPFPADLPINTKNPRKLKLKKTDIDTIEKTLKKAQQREQSLS
jgi:uncharacterized protein